MVDRSREVVPGMITCGMETAELESSPRMGPTFGELAPAAGAGLPLPTPLPHSSATLLTPPANPPTALPLISPPRPPSLPAGAMFISGQKAAHVALNALRRQQDLERAAAGEQQKQPVAA